IANSFKDRSRKDIGKWRKALYMAEHPTNPTWQPLMDLYKDLETDGHLKSQMRLIRSSILNTTFHIVDDNTSDIDAETTKLINKKWFYDLISHSINALFYGHSVIQLEEVGDSPKLQLIPRRNVVPQHKKIVPDFTRPLEVIYYDAPEYQNWVIDFGDDDEDFGLLNNIVPNLIWKRNVLQSWAEFCERFGIPMLTATTIRSTPEAINEIEEMLHQLGEAAVGVFPEGTNIDFKEANRTDAYQTFDKMIDRCNSEISKLLVAGVMLSDNGSSRSQSEVHERNLDDRISATDRRNISFFINDVVIPVLTWHGFPFKPTHRFTFDTTQELKLMEHWQIVSQLMNVADVDMEWVSRTFNVPLAEKKKTDLKPIAQSKAFDVVNDDRYTDVEFCQNCYVALNEQQLGDLNRLNGLLIQLFFEEKDTFQAWANITKWEATLLFKGLLEGYGNRLTQAEWNAPDHLMLAMMEQNLYDFTTGKVEARLASMSNLLIDYKEGKLRSYDEFKSEAEKVMGKFNDRYLKTEYNLSVAVGQNSAAFMRAWADKDDFPYVQYITAGDPNVRDSHAVLNHKIFKLDDENARKLLPPNGYGCRCEMISYPHKPHESGVSKGSWGVAQLGEKFKNGNFAVNRADLKQVFLK
ncbi:MAG TPA: DUF935 family protein, partial [Crocinitomicaceae bacterium]|nr:DUF935 family protein [Crocinitomicaceae bacterium]